MKDKASFKENKEMLNPGASCPGLPSHYPEEDVLEEPPDPPNPPGATLSRQGDVETLDDDLDAFTLHAQHEALQRAKRDWQQAREALVDELQLHQEFECEREALYLQLQKDRKQQEHDLLQAAEKSKQELLQELQHLRSLHQRETDGVAAQQAERQQLQREREPLDRQRAALLQKEREHIDLEAQEQTAAADLQCRLSIQTARQAGP
uniref:Uncharacterized protein n=1 Tax=Sphaerodactylus townsendi TaxID=933632 RepID=A0ACB8F297_9SAUR